MENRDMFQRLMWIGNWPHRFQKLATNTLACLLLSLAFVTPSSSWGGDSRIPDELLEQLVRDRYWIDEHEDSLYGFWRDLNDSGVQPQKIVDQIFGRTDQERTSATLNQTYPAKMSMLRHLETISPRRANRVFVLWRNHYLDISFYLLRLSNVDEVIQALDIFQKSRSNIEMIRDLSPRVRKKLQEEISTTHNLRLDAVYGGRSQLAGRYKVTGMYNARQGRFYVDFIRPPEETLITLAHEIMHAADPLMAEYRKTAEELLPSVVKILTKWSGGRKAAALMALDVLDHTFHETKIERFMRVMSRVQNETIDAINASVKFVPNERELNTLQRWMEATVGLLVGNEYRAYFHSLRVYINLKDQMGVIPPDPAQQRFLDRFGAGGEALALHLSMIMNPFDGDQRQAIIHRYRDEDGEPIEPKKREEEEDRREIFANATEMMDFLSGQYLEAAKKFQQQIEIQARSELDRKIIADQEALNSVIPDWTRPGGFNRLSSPYSILETRLTLPRLKRFKISSEEIHEELMSMTEPLYMARTGILDVHHLNDGEMALVGIYPVNSPHRVAFRNDEISPESVLRTPLAEIPREVREKFKTVEWSYSMGPISQEEVTQNIVRLHLLRVTAWIDRQIHGDVDLLKGIQQLNLFLDKLSKPHLLNSEDFPPERAEALKNEIVTALEMHNNSVEEIQRIHYLTERILILHEAAADQQWNEIAQRFLVLSEILQARLESYRIYAPDSYSEMIRRTEGEITNLKRQIWNHKEVKSCRRKPKSIMELHMQRDVGPFTVGNFTFNLMVICNHGNRVSAVRQQGDVTSHMPTINFLERLPNGDLVPYPQVSIGSNPRPVSLTPIEFGEAASSGFNFFNLFRSQK